MLLGVIPGDTVNLNLGGAVGAFDNKNVGTGKTVTVSGLTFDGVDAGNYDLIQPSTIANVTPATLQYVANVASRTYGAVNPAFSGTVIGFVAGESQATATTGTLNFSTTAVATTNVGNHAINGSGLTANLGNYTFQQHPSNAVALTVSPANLIVQANDHQKTQNGQPFTDFQVSYIGFVNGEDAGVLGGTLSFIGDAVSAVEPGIYTVIPQGLTSTNYNIVFQNGSLTIHPVLTAGILVTGSDAGGDPLVRIFDVESGVLKNEFLAFDSGFRGGIRVATGDINSDGIPDILVAAGPGAGPHIKVFDGNTFVEIASFLDSPNV